MECIDLEKRRNGSSPASSWDLPIESSSARPLSDRLACDMTVFICRRWKQFSWWFFLLPSLLLTAVTCVSTMRQLIVPLELLKQ